MSNVKLTRHRIPLEFAEMGGYSSYTLVPLAFALSALAPGPWLEPLMVGAGTIAGCWLLHEYLIRRSTLLRPLFGLPARTPVRAPAAATATPHL